MEDLNDRLDPGLGWELRVASDINARGWIVGFGAHDGRIRAYRLDRREIRDLGTIPGANITYARGVNDRGHVVGEAYVAGGRRAFVYTDARGMEDLNELIDPAAGWLLERAWDINNRGQIVGRGLLDGEPHVYRLTQCPRNTRRE